MTKRQLTKLYEEVKPVIVARAVSWSETTGWDIGELISVGNWLFMRELHRKKGRFDPKKSSIKSWMRRRLDQYYCDYTQRLRKSTMAFVDPETLLILEATEAMRPGTALPFKDARWSAEFRETLIGLSEEAQAVAKILIDGPAEALGVLGSEAPRMIRGALRRHLRSLGWSVQEISRAFNELKDFVR